MGRPLFSSSSPSFGPNDTSREEDVAVAKQGPRTWCETDVDPDSDAWWDTNEIFIESFTTSVAGGERGTALETNGRVKAPAVLVDQDVKLEQEKEIQTDTDFFQLFPKKYTISEEELAHVQLDTVQVDDEDDFELAWDEEELDGDDMDVEVDQAAVHSDVSTPTPSTPVSASQTVSLPIAVPSTPGATRRLTLPMSISSTPIRQNSFPAGTPSMSPIPIATPSSMTTRSVARVRGFAVHSPRTELVL